MSEAQQAMHVVDYYLWQAMQSDGPYKFHLNTGCAVSYYHLAWREVYLDEREIERDKRENW